ncbi:hypothetical protein Lal_00041609 [Lupinus albus]|nr:hypothetical protein Lal_00041609 [Lupinus albus]
MGTTTNDSIIFGGKVVVFGGDFRQILLVIPRGCRLDIVILNLTKNKHLENDDSAAEIREFSEWIENSGNLGYTRCFSLEREGLAQARGGVSVSRISWDSRLGERKCVDTGGFSLERDGQI